MLQVQDLLRAVVAARHGFDAAKKAYADRLAPDFNPFQFIGPDEVKLSRIVAWLLDPTETHAQDRKFLNCLLRKIGTEWPMESLNSVSVKTEVWVDQGRIDIQVLSPGRIIVIENKPWADDGNQQVSRYFRYLDEARVDDFTLIYLTPSGSEPTERSLPKTEAEKRISDGQLHLWSYTGSVLDWLSDCRRVCRADRVSLFLDQFSDYVREQFEGTADMTMINQLIEQATASPETVSAAMQLIFAADKIRARLLENLHNEILIKTATKTWRVDWDLSEPHRFAGFVIRFAEDEPWGFCFEFQSGEIQSATVWDLQNWWGSKRRS